MSDIVGALRVKNEARWIQEVLGALEFCDGVYLFDDHSSDRTGDLARDMGALVTTSPFKGLDEARDKEFLVAEIDRDWDPETWILMIDGDEVMEPDGGAKIREVITGTPRAFSLRILYLWNTRDQVRVDGVYGRFRRPSLFRLGDDFRFKRTTSNGNLHCSSVPECHIENYGECDASLLHLGYMDREDRIRKWEYYNTIDPRNPAEGYNASFPNRGNYPHMVQGDIPEVPADAKLLHAGPLKIENLEVANNGA